MGLRHGVTRRRRSASRPHRALPVSEDGQSRIRRGLWSRLPLSVVRRDGHKSPGGGSCASPARRVSSQRCLRRSRFNPRSACWHSKTAWGSRPSSHADGLPRPQRHHLAVLFDADLLRQAQRRWAGVIGDPPGCGCGTSASVKLAQTGYSGAQNGFCSLGRAVNAAAEQKTSSSNGEMSNGREEQRHPCCAS